MKLGMQVGLGPRHIVLDGDPPTAAPDHFSAHVYCGQTVTHLSNCRALVFIGTCISSYITANLIDAIHAMLTVLTNHNNQIYTCAT